MGRGGEREERRKSVPSGRGGKRGGELSWKNHRQGVIPVFNGYKVRSKGNLSPSRDS